MSEPAKKRNTYAEQLSPEYKGAEVGDSAPPAQPRSTVRHALATSRLSAQLAGFDSDDDSMLGGWVILHQPFLRLGPPGDVVVPDLAGWRRGRTGELSLSAPFVTSTPDWVCEVSDASTKALERADKMPLYARHGVVCAWLIDPEAQLLEVYELERGRWTVAQVFRGNALVRVSPFDVRPLRLGALWSF